MSILHMVCDDQNSGQSQTPAPTVSDPVVIDGDTVQVDWTDNGSPDATVIQHKLTAEDDSQYSQIYTGTDETHTENSLTPGSLNSFRLRSEKAGFLPSDWVEFEDVRPTAFNEIYEELTTNDISLFHFQRKDKNYSDSGATTEVTDNDGIHVSHDLVAGGVEATQATAGDQLTWEGTEGLAEGVGGAGTETDHMDISSSIGGSDITIIIAHKYDGSTNGQRFSEAVVNGPGVRATTDDTTRLRTEDGTSHDFDHPDNAYVTGDNVTIFTVEQDSPSPGDTEVKMYINGVHDNSGSNNMISSVSTLTEWLIDTFGNTGNSQRAASEGMYGHQIKDYVMDQTAVTEWTSRWATAIQAGVEDWTQETTGGGGGSSRPDQDDHIDDMDTTATPPANVAGAVAINELPFPRPILTESKSIGTTGYFGLNYIVSAQKTAIQTMKTLYDNEGTYPMTHISWSANQSRVIAANTGNPSIAGEAGFGMAFTDLGTTTVGTEDTPEIFVKHFTFTRASQLTSSLGSGEGATCNIDNIGWQDVNKWVIIFSGAHDDFTNPEICYLDAKPGGSTVRITNRGDTGTSARTHSSGEWMRTFGRGPNNGNADNLRYNLVDLPAFEDGAGRTGAEAQANFVVENWDRDEDDNQIAGYAAIALGVFTDIDRESEWNARDTDLLLDQTANTGWDGQTNEYEIAQLVTRNAIKTGIDADVGSGKIFPRGTEYAYRMDSSFGIIAEDIGSGGQQTNTIGSQQYDGHMNHLYMYTRYSEYGPALVGMVDKHGNPSTTPNSAIMKTNTYCMANMCKIDGFYGKMNLGGQSPGTWMDMPFPVPMFINVGQGGATGSYGDCIFPYVGTYTPAQAKVCRGWLGDPLWDRVRIYDTEAWSIANALEEELFTSGITGWSGDTSNIAHDAVDDALEWQGWTGSVKKNNWGTAGIDGPDFAVTNGDTYTIIAEMRCIDGTRDCRTLRFGLAGHDAQIYTIGPNWMRIVNTFEGQVNGNRAVRFDCGFQEEHFQIRSVRMWQGDLRLFRRDFDNGIVIVNGAGSPQRTMQLGGTYTVPLLSGSGASTYDPDNIWVGGDVTEYTLESGQGMFLLNPE